jgi:hypothetical protein
MARPSSTRRRAMPCAIALLMACWLLPTAAAAHSTKIAFFDIAQKIDKGPKQTREATAVWVAQPRDDVRPVFDARCTSKRINGKPGAPVAVYTISCPGGLAGKTLKTSGQDASKYDVIVHLRDPKGKTALHVLRSQDESFTVPGKAEKATASTAFGRFLLLGMEHFILGPDHILFVLALIFLVQAKRRIFYLVTAFTVGHSISLMLAAFGLLSLPVAATEALIALSLVMIALEIPVGPAPGAKLASFGQGYFGLLAVLAVGLVHGLGFADVLSGLQLQSSQRVVSVLAFNLGIEIAQVAFIAVAMVLLVLARRLVDRLVATRYARHISFALVACYLVGGLGTYWVFERLASVEVRHQLLALF